LRRVEWPEYPRTGQKDAGLLLAANASTPLIGWALFFSLRAAFELRHEATPWPVLLGSLLAAITITVLAPLLYLFLAPYLLRSVRVRSEGIEFGTLRRRFVRSTEIRRAVVSEPDVILELTDGREVRLRVLDAEGLAETLRERWGVEVARG
jgi:hypothetical protein